MTISPRVRNNAGRRRATSHLHCRCLPNAMEIARSAAIAEREIKRHISAYRSRRYCPFGSRERLRQIIAGDSNDPRRTAASCALTGGDKRLKRSEKKKHKIKTLRNIPKVSNADLALKDNCVTKLICSLEYGPNPVAEATMHSKLLQVLAVSASVIGIGAAANAQQSGPVDVAKYQYDAHCAVCHGVAGKG